LILIKFETNQQQQQKSVHSTRQTTSRKMFVFLPWLECWC